MYHYFYCYYYYKAPYLQSQTMHSVTPQERWSRKKAATLILGPKSAQKGAAELKHECLSYIPETTLCCLKYILHLHTHSRNVGFQMVP